MCPTFFNNIKIKRIKIGHDSKAAASAWKCEYVQIVADNETYLFMVNEWIQSPQLTVEVDVLPNQSKQNVLGLLCQDI